MVLFKICFTGVIRTALHNMDREAREHYSVVIQAKDMAGQVGGLSGSTTVNITLTDVNDNPPRFPQSMYLFLLSCAYHYWFIQNKTKSWSLNDMGLSCKVPLDFFSVVSAAVLHSKIGSWLHLQIQRNPDTEGSL